jgi:hypothetical protein
MDRSHCRSQSPTNDRTQSQSWSPDRNIGANGRICIAPLESPFSTTLALRKEHFSNALSRVPKNGVSRSKRLLNPQPQLH